MPWRMILFVIALIIITVFAGFNLDNKCTISFVFLTIENAPVFLCLMIAFLAGMVVMLPIAFVNRKRKQDGGNKAEKKAKSSKSNKGAVTTVSSYNDSVDSVISPADVSPIVDTIPTAPEDNNVNIGKDEKNNS